jgi:hypothetical protein
MREVLAALGLAVFTLGFSDMPGLSYYEMLRNLVSLGSYLIRLCVNFFTAFRDNNVCGPFVSLNRSGEASIEPDSICLSADTNVVF